MQRLCQWGTLWGKVAQRNLCYLHHPLMLKLPRSGPTISVEMSSHVLLTMAQVWLHVTQYLFHVMNIILTQLSFSLYFIYMLWSICRVHMIYEHARHVPTPPLLWLRYAKARTRQRPRTLRLLPIRGLNLLSPEISSYVAKLPPRANAEKTNAKKTNMERKARPMARKAANWRGPVAAVWTPFGHTAAAPCPKRGRLGMMVLKNRHQWSQVHVPLRKGKASRKKARQNMQHDQNKHPRRRQPQSEKQRQRQRQQSPKQRPGEGLSLNHMIPKSFVNVSWLMRSMHSRRLMTSKTFALKFLQTGRKRSQLRSLRSTPRAWFLSSGGSQSRTSTGPEVL